eukprot:evm.model.NODE_7421_length_28612_cov_28.772577.11
MNRGRVTFVTFAVLPTLAQAIHYFTGLDSLAGLEIVGVTDSKGMVVKNTLVSFSNKQCIQDLYDLDFPFSFIDLPSTTHELANVLVETPSNELMDFFDVHDCKSFVYFTAGDSLQARGMKLTPTSGQQLGDFFWEKQRLPDFKIRNDLDKPLNVYWESWDVQPREVSVMQLVPGQEQSFGTFLSHTLIFRDVDNNMRLMARAVITDGSKPIVISELLAGPADTEVLQLTDHQVKVWRGRRRTNISRLKQNEAQPPTVRTFTDVGFRKQRIPANLLRHLQEFHEQNEDKRADEGWNEDDLHVNFYESMTTVVALDHKMRELVFGTIKPILESWVGGEKLVPTSTYGIRRYYNGSVLRDHVDIGATHVVSAILNLGQDVDEVWPLQILDHEGRRHFIEMAAGDMCLYESATSIHGRTQAMVGRTFDNIFTHFAPVKPFDVVAAEREAAAVHPKLTEAEGEEEGKDEDMVGEGWEVEEDENGGWLLNDKIEKEHQDTPYDDFEEGTGLMEEI